MKTINSDLIKSLSNSSGWIKSRTDDTNISWNKLLTDYSDADYAQIKINFDDHWLHVSGECKVLQSCPYPYLRVILSAAGKINIDVTLTKSKKYNYSVWLSNRTKRSNGWASTYNVSYDQNRRYLLEQNQVRIVIK